MRAVIIAVLLGGCAFGGPGIVEPTPDNVAAQFEAAAFHSDFRTTHGIVTRWSTDPVFAWLDTPQTTELAQWHASEFAAVKREIEALTGRELRPADAADRVTLRLGFLPRRRFPEVIRSLNAQAAPRIACMATYRMNHVSGEIGSAVIVFGTDISDRLRRDCILEELVQVMGLPADACHYRPSVFCEDDRVFEMTPADRLLLAVLYDPRLRSGMPRDAAMPVVRNVIAERWPEFQP